MSRRKKIVEEIIARNADNALEEAAVEEHIGIPSDDEDLPNLRKDRIELELTNRTDEEQEIDLFDMPAGINPSQGINYGDLFETYYCQVVVPLSEFMLTQTFTITWTDENGNHQSATTGSIEGIDILITELESATDDSWDYILEGSNYIIFKKPISTYVY